MSNSTGTGGYLSQQNASLSDDAALDAIQEAVVGIVGLPGSLVRPRWQLNPPRAPENTVNWVAIGVSTRERLDYPVLVPNDQGTWDLIRQTTLSILTSFYGPNAQGNAERLRDGLYIRQNFEQLSPTGDIKLLDAGDVVAAPELVGTQWYNRADMPLRLSVATRRTFNILDIASSDIEISTDTSVQNSLHVTQ